MTTRAGGVVVSVEASTLDFTRGMELAVRSLLGFERASESATRTTNAIQRSVRSLALEAVGASGPFARIGEHILAALGPSSAPIIAAIAGAGILWKLMERSQEEAAKTAKAFDEMAKANRAFVTQRNPTAQAANALFGGSGEKGEGPNLPEQQTALQKQLNQLRLFRETRTGPTDIQNQIDEVQKRLDDVNTRIAQSRSVLADAAGKAGQSGIDTWLEEQKKQFAAIKARKERAEAMAKYELEGWKPGVIGSEDVRAQASRAFLARTSFRTPLSLDLAHNQPFQDIKIQTAGENYRRQAEAQDEAAKAAAKTVSQVRALASGLDLLGAVAGQSTTRVGQFISGIGGILGSVKGVNPLIGAGIEIGGSLINLLFGHHNKPAQVEVTNFADLARAQRSGPDKVSINVIGSNGEVVKTADVYIRRRQARDGVVRVPWGAAAA